MKREKRQKLVSRRKQALRRILTALFVLFLVNYILGIGLLFPLQAIRHNEERMGTGRTAVVCRDREAVFRWNFLAYLTENEDVTMLSGTDLGLYGWMEAFGVALDCTEEAPIHGGWWSMSRKQGPSLFYVFGRIDGPEIDRLEVFLLHTGDSLDEERIGQVSGDWGIDRDSKSWMEKDGRTYFLLKTYPVDWSDYPRGFSVVAVGYNKAGEEIARVELDQGASSSFA